MTVDTKTLLTGSMLSLIAEVQKHRSVAYDDVWAALAHLAAYTLILTPAAAHDEAFDDLRERVKQILEEYKLDHSRGVQP